MPETGNRILFVSDCVPGHGTGVQICLFRHLCRLAESGWEIAIASKERERIGANLPVGWQTAWIPQRRWWWPPARESNTLSMALRFRIWEQECRKQLGTEQFTSILTWLDFSYPLLAMHLARRWQIPLSVLVYDEREAWIDCPHEKKAATAQSAKVLQAADRVWFVSDALRQRYIAKLNLESIRAKSRVLMPIPGGGTGAFVKWRPEMEERPVVVYAGKLHDFYFENLTVVATALEKLNGTLHLITDAGHPVLGRLRQEHPNVTHHDFFASNDDLLRYVSETATAFLATYAFDPEIQPWSASSFPSKIVEFSHTGLPILTLTPPFTAFAQWARQHHWEGCIESLAPSAVLEGLRPVTQRPDWETLAAQSKKAAANSFCPAAIQQQFECELAKR